MVDAYEDFENGDDQEGNDDDEMDAFESIMSWDENEDDGADTNGESNAALSDQIAGNNLPDLVSFNSLKDDGLNANMLQLFNHANAATVQNLNMNNGAAVGLDSSVLSIPMPNPVQGGNNESSTLAESQSMPLVGAGASSATPATMGAPPASALQHSLPASQQPQSTSFPQHQNTQNLQHEFPNSTNQPRKKQRVHNKSHPSSFTSSKTKQKTEALSCGQQQRRRQNSKQHKSMARSQTKPHAQTQIQPTPQQQQQQHQQQHQQQQFVQPANMIAASQPAPQPQTQQDGNQAAAQGASQNALNQRGALSLSMYQQGALLAQSRIVKQQHHHAPTAPPQQQQQQQQLQMPQPTQVQGHTQGQVQVQPQQQQLSLASVVPQSMLQSVAATIQSQQAHQPFGLANSQNAVRQIQLAQLHQRYNAAQAGAAPMQQPFMSRVAGVASLPAQQAPAPASSTQAQADSKKMIPQTTLSAQHQASSVAAVASLQQPRQAVVSASDTDGELTSSLTLARGDRKGASLLSSTSASLAASLSTRKRADPIDTSNMTPEDRARINRDRNREHARNTRMRKKAYLEKLKSMVEDLCRERDTLMSERAGAANILVEMHNTRTEVLMSFFALRSANEKRRELWASILDESCFACVIPVTPYRSFPASEVQVSKCQRTILGIDGMMADTASLHVLLNSLVDRSRYPNATIKFRYTLVTEEAVVAGNQMMARWVMTTENAAQCGARMEVTKQGMLCCKFNSAHKIIGLELMFDVMALMLQLKQAAGSDTFSVVPNTVQTCQRNFDMPMLMMLADEPYTIVQVNKLWENMSNYQAEQVVGKSSCRILEGEATDPTAVEALINEIRYKRPASAMVVHYKKTGERFRNFFLAFPLSTDSRITHYLMLSTHVEPIATVLPTPKDI